MAQFQSPLAPQPSPESKAKGSLENAENRFKPVALPALAAAVQASKRRPAHTPKPKDWPACLREDALFG